MFQSETYFFEQPERTQQADDPTLDFGIKRYASFFFFENKNDANITTPFYCVKEPRVHDQKKKMTKNDIRSLYRVSASAGRAMTS